MEFNNWYEALELFVGVAFLLALILPYDFKDRSVEKNKLILLAFINYIWSVFDIVINYIFKFRELGALDIAWQVPALIYCFIYIKKRKLAMPFLKICIPLMSLYSLIYGGIKVSWFVSLFVFIVLILPFNIYFFWYGKKLKKEQYKMQVSES